ncbi:hypothetical protein DPMN_024845 [Dreissena polymorpha]|uniref:Uncharacterized protein n=1 Tax=Dreissena polymorpha TaxID=45954 RepID=A0A9D4LN79_DREPO|nr:hypothetical protein DPMN_024845 [Dreissena polymorpha]
MNRRDVSPCFKVYKTLYLRSHENTSGTSSTATISSCADCVSGSCLSKAHDAADLNNTVTTPNEGCNKSSGLDLLASVVCCQTENEKGVSNDQPETSDLMISPALKKRLIYPVAETSKRPNGQVPCRICLII